MPIQWQCIDLVAILIVRTCRDSRMADWEASLCAFAITARKTHSVSLLEGEMVDELQPKYSANAMQSGGNGIKNPLICIKVWKTQ